MRCIEIVNNWKIRYINIMININMRCIEIFLELREAMQNMD